MKREDLEHVIRAAGDVLGGSDVVVVGSQAIVGAGVENLPARACASIEADIMPFGEDPDGRKAMLINGVLGEDGPFHAENGYYAEGVESGAIRAPAGWRDRLIPLRGENTNGVTGWCLEAHDICVAKLLAGREKDIAYVRAVIEAGVVDPAVMVERLVDSDASPEEAARFLRRLKAMRRPGRRTSYRRVLRQVQNWTQTAAPSPATTTRPTTLPPPSPHTEPVARCGAWMPRAKTRCALRPGHRGSHRQG